MKKEIKRTQLFSSFFWKTLERTSTQFLQLIVQILLARLLLPSEFGIIAIILVFYNLGLVFVQSGFSTALIQKKELSEEEINSVFTLSLFIATAIYFIIYIYAPNIAKTYNEPYLTNTLRVMMLSLFPGAFYTVQNALVSRDLDYKLLFKSNFVSVLIGSIVGVVLALMEFGLWALIAQFLTNQYLLVIILFFKVNWNPKLYFSFNNIKYIYSFGWKILLSSLINTIQYNIRTLVIGIFYSSNSVGIYNRGLQFPHLIVNNLNLIIQSVMLPMLSKNQDYSEKILITTRKMIQISSFFIVPLLVIMAVVAEPLIIILLTEKWIDSVPYLQIFSISYLVVPIFSAYTLAFTSVGKSAIVLKLEVLNFFVTLVFLAISLPFGLISVALGQMTAMFIKLIYYIFIMKKTFNTTYKSLLSDFISALLISIPVAIVGIVIGIYVKKIFLKIVLQILITFLLYILCSVFLNRKAINLLVFSIKNLKEEKNNV